MFLLPGVIEEAQARTDSTAISSAGPFTNVKWMLTDGVFVTPPIVFGPTITWETTGSGLFGGSERGIITADVGSTGKVVFFFSNPNRGPNTCNTTVTAGPIQGTCYIGQGASVTALFQVSPVGQQNDNVVCGILSKLDDDRIRDIRDKLNC